MTAALLARPAASKAGCRFPEWCRDLCDDGNGERNHWSSYTMFWAFDLADERLGVQLYDYENDRDGIDPVLVYIAAGDDGMDEDGCSIPGEQARSLGTVLKDFSPRNKWPGDERIHTALDADGHWAIIADYRRERLRRDGSPQDEHVEFSIRPDTTRRHSIRVRLSMRQAHRFGLCLITEADRAAASNVKFGLSR